MKQKFTVLLISISTLFLNAENSWKKSVEASIQKLNTFNPPQDWFVPVVTEPIVGGQKAQKVKLNVSRLNEIWLIADKNGTNAADHACWGSPVLIDANSVKTPLVTLKPKSVKVGYGKLEKGTFSISGTEFPNSIFAHAQSKICYQIDQKYQFLEVAIGLRSTAGKGGSIIFKVLADPQFADSLAPLKRKLWTSLQKQHPIICRQLLKDFPNNSHFELIFHYKDKTQQLQKATKDSLRDLGFDYSDLLNGSPLMDYGDIAQITEKAMNFRKKFLDNNPKLVEVFELDGSGFFYLAEQVKSFNKDDNLRISFTKFKQQLANLEKEYVIKGVLDPQVLKDKGNILLNLANRIADASGWPTFLGNNQRSGYTARSLEFPLYPNWVCKTSDPDPAWPAPAVSNPRVKQLLSPTLTFDRTLHTVGISNRIFFGSSSENSVFALDSRTGKMKWRFICDGPVRIPPYLYKDRVYAGSDDGFFYCLDQKSGKLIWKYSVGPTRRFIGNGRLMSRLPIRCGICIEDNKVYFTAGLFPSEGAFLIALDADKGTEIWKEKIDASPQGFLLSSPSRLFLPTGRTPFIEHNRETGKKIRQLGNSQPWGNNLIGGCSAVVVDENIITGPSEDGQFHLFSKDPQEKIIRSKGLHMIVRGRYAYILGHDTLTAIDRGSYLDKHQPKTVWTAPTEAPYSMIMAGDSIICGGDNRVFAFNATDGKKLWSESIKGKALGLSVINGGLIVSTDSGVIHSFIATNSKCLLVKTNNAKKPKAKRSSINIVSKLLQRGKLRKGYLCLFEIGDGSLLNALAISKDHNLRTICLESSQEKVKLWQERLAETGLIGTRIEILHMSEKSSLPRYFADYMINGAELTDDSFVTLRKHILRPDGGLACTIVADKTLQFYKNPALPGTGNWATTYGDSGNSACSKDNTVYTNPEILWFGRPGANHMIDRHDRNTPPLYKGSTMFISGMNYLFAINGYNGTVIWEKEVPHSARAALPKNCGNMVVDDALYIANGNKCTKFESESGKILKEFIVPAKEKDWGFLSLYKNVLIGSSCVKGAALYKRDDKFDYKMIWYNNYVTCSESFFALNRKTGKKSWKYKSDGVIINPTIATSGKQLYFLETGASKKLVGLGKYLLDDIHVAGTFLTSIDVTTGKVLWHHKIDTTMMRKVIFLTVSGDTVLLSGSQHKQLKDSKRIRYELIAFDTKDGKKRWNTSEKPDYDWVLNGEHGEQTQHPTVAKDVIYGPGFAVNLKDGSPYQGWKWSKSQKCATVCSSNNYVFSRFSNAKTPHMFSLIEGKSIELTKASRPGCWINMLPVGGLILIPEFSAGCTCPYSIQTSLALIPTEVK